jgi:hypothetical protein
MKPLVPTIRITRTRHPEHGTVDTVWLKRVVCWWVLNRGELMAMTPDLSFSDEELLRVAGEYIRWRRRNPPGPAS